MSLRSDHRATVDQEAARLPSVIDVAIGSVARREQLDAWLVANEQNPLAIEGFFQREGEDGAIAIAARMRSRIAAMTERGAEWPYAGAGSVTNTRALIEAFEDQPLTPWLWAELFGALPSYHKVTAFHLGAAGRRLGWRAVPAIREAIRRRVPFRSNLFQNLREDNLLTDEEALLGIADPPLRLEAQRYLITRVGQVEPRLRDMLPDATKGTREVIVRLLRQVDKRIDIDGGAVSSDLGELEIRLRDDPSDAETAQVWADLLMERGDPRGTIVALQQALAEQTDPVRALEISGELAEHCHAHRKGWFGKPGGFPFRDKYLGRSYHSFTSSWRGLIRGKPSKVFDRTMAFITEITDVARPSVDLEDAGLDDDAFRAACIHVAGSMRAKFKLTWPGTKIALPYQERGHYPDHELASSLTVNLETGKLELSLAFPFDELTDPSFVQIYEALVETLGKIVMTPTGFAMLSPTADGKKMKRKLCRYRGPV